MYHSTGFTTAEVTELGARIEARGLSPRMRRWPPVIGLRNALTVTLTYLRRNRVQAEIAEHYGVAQPAISRAVSAIAPAAGTSASRRRPHGRRTRRRSLLHRGRHAAPVLVGEGAPGTVLREA